MITPFKGSNCYTIDELPRTDVLIITHDHYDHLDYRTVKAIREHVARVVCPLGVGRTSRTLGLSGPIASSELDWDETTSIGNGVQLHCLSTQHFSGRALHPGNTLWAAFLLESPTRKNLLFWRRRLRRALQKGARAFRQRRLGTHRKRTIQ